MRGETRKCNALRKPFNGDERSRRETSRRSWRPRRKDKSEVRERGGEGLPDRERGPVPVQGRETPKITGCGDWACGLRVVSGEGACTAQGRLPCRAGGTPSCRPWRSKDSHSHSSNRTGRPWRIAMIVGVVWPVEKSKMHVELKKRDDTSLTLK